MKRIKSLVRKSKYLVPTSVAAAVIGIGLTVAFFTDIEAAVNHITAGTVEISVEETLEDLVKSEIGVTSNGKSESYVRLWIGIPDVTYEYTEGENVRTGVQAQIKTVDSRIWTAAEWTAADRIPAVVLRSDGTREDARWEKLDDYWYLSVTLHQGERAEFLSSVTYPGLWDDEAGDGSGGLVSPLPSGITTDMLTIPVLSEVIQADNIPISGEDRQSAEAARRAFEYVHQAEADRADTGNQV